MSRPAATHGHPNEELFGFSQATRAGAGVYVAGQVARDRSGVPAGLTFDAKTGKAARKAEEALEQVGARLGDVAWAQLLVTRPIDEAVARSCRAHLGPARAAIAVAHVPTLNSDDFEVEITAIARSGDMHEVVDGDGLDEQLGRVAGVRAGEHVYFGGHLSVGADGVPVAGGLAEHFVAALDRLLATAAALGAAPRDVVWLQYLTCAPPDPEAFRGPVSDAHRERFPGPDRPATSLIGVTGLAVPGALVEVTGFAVARTGAT